MEYDALGLVVVVVVVVVVSPLPRLLNSCWTWAVVLVVAVVPRWRWLCWRLLLLLSLLVVAVVAVVVAGWGAVVPLKMGSRVMDLNIRRKEQCVCV